MKQVHGKNINSLLLSLGIKIHNQIDVTLFPGQGTQYPGMLKEFYENFTSAKETCERVSEALKLDMAKLILDDPQGLLDQTEYTQPAIMTASLSILAVFEREFGFSVSSCDYLAGHSLGEYSSSIASGVISLEEGAKLLRTRGKLMQQYSPAGGGAMLAIIGANSSYLSRVIDELSSRELFIAGDNSSRQVIVSGTKLAISNLKDYLKDIRGIKIMPLKVSVPAHSKYMQPAAEELLKSFKQITMKPPIASVLSCCEAMAFNKAGDIRDSLYRQIFTTVRWREIMHYLRSQAVERVIELGPGNLLTGFFRQEIPEIECLNINSIKELEKASQ